MPVSALSAASHTQVNLAPNTTASIYVAAYTLSGDGPLTFSNTFYTLSTNVVSVANKPAVAPEVTTTSVAGS